MKEIIKLDNAMLGLDPEFFVRSLETGEVVPATNYPILGTKHDKYDLGDGVSIHLDNVAVELDLPPISLTAEDGMLFGEGVAKAKAKTNKYLAQYGLCLDEESYYKEFSFESLMDLRSWEFGCDPDYDSWTMEKGSELTPDIMKNIRTPGGHIHLSYTNLNGIPSEVVARTMDILVGLPMVIADKNRRVPSEKRRKFYGQAGKFRPKSYGLEYRTPGNAWVTSNTYTSMVFELMQIVADQPTLSSGVLAKMPKTIVEIQSTINENNKEKALDLINDLNLYGVIDVLGAFGEI